MSCIFCGEDEQICTCNFEEALALAGPIIPNNTDELFNMYDELELELDEQEELGGVPVDEWFNTDPDDVPRIPWYDDDDIVGGNADIMSEDEEEPSRRSQYIDYLAEMREERGDQQAFDEVYDELFPDEQQNCGIESDGDDAGY